MGEREHRDAPSILDLIDARGGKAPRVSLPDAGDAPPELSEVALERRGRFQVLGQIAKGGVGQILKGHDVDLNRDVALKMLRERHLGNHELIQRFVEEAQIGGQLQHPGIVPVYELGLGDDQRPYFAMKLVKGRTLAALLVDRSDPSEDRRRFLAIFEQVCQTMAYAHSRGVIHRDLKPSNIMIGAFGEVQVVDWGFAKVLAQGGVADERRARLDSVDVTRIATVRSTGEGSDSIAGEVMGTPAYMPSEQALGHVDDLDERSDVFSLGAILCEILTGEPPYTAQGMERLTLAAGGKVEEAHARLDACGAERGMVALTKRCLMPLRKGRPRDAGVLSATLTRHMGAAEVRAKRSKLAAIEARREAARVSAETADERALAEQAKVEATKQRSKLERNRARAEHAREVAQSARRSRRLTLMIAGAVVLVLLVAGAGTLWLAGSRAEHARETTQSVDDLLERASLLAGGKSWDEAFAVLAQARGMARVGDLAENALPRVDAAEADMRERQKQLLATDERARKVADFRNRLARIRLGGEDDAAFENLFREFGIDIASSQASMLLARWKELTPDLATALDVWAWERSRGPGRALLLRLADGLDPDRHRKSVRAAIESGDERSLQTLCAGLEVESGDVRTMDLLGYSLLKRFAAKAAADLLRQVQRHHPDDAWVSYHLGLALLKLEYPRVTEALRFFEAALAGQPECDELRAVMEKERAGGSDLDRFRTRLRSERGFGDPNRWFQVDLTWSRVTGRRRLIHVEKRATVEALVSHGGRKFGYGKTCPPLVYPVGTVFVAETFDHDGKMVVQTEALRIGSWPKTEFFVFDEQGRYTKTFIGQQKRAPRVCAECHLAPRGALVYRAPMMDFPNEGYDSRIEIGKAFRNATFVACFIEHQNRGSNLFGPYASMWLSRLAADAAAEKLVGDDRRHYERLSKVHDFLPLLR
jgi:tRNA A-37 threonylcarbamoyl transferase component Bud32/tetratricopeptide (TPR) repeat protein